MIYMWRSNNCKNETPQHFHYMLQFPWQRLLQIFYPVPKRMLSLILECLQKHLIQIFKRHFLYLYLYLEIRVFSHLSPFLKKEVGAFDIPTKGESFDISRTAEYNSIFFVCIHFRTNYRAVFKCFLWLKRLLTEYKKSTWQKKKV